MQFAKGLCRMGRSRSDDYLFGKAEYEHKEPSSMRHAFILSMYFLMRAADKPIDTFYDWAIR